MKGHNPCRIDKSVKEFVKQSQHNLWNKKDFNPSRPVHFEKLY